jgi:hypothetical protein
MSKQSFVLKKSLEEMGFIQREDNIFHAEKAFIVAPLLLEKAYEFSAKKISLYEYVGFIKILKDFKDGKINFFKEDGVLKYVSKDKDENKNEEQ